MKSVPIIMGSERSEAGLPAGARLLAEGASALDAVEAALRLCEDNLSDHYMGTGGLPNARGEVELDASLMVGSSRAFGAVGAVKGFAHPISIARRILETLPQHCLLVGEGAELFAEEEGFERSELLTDEAWQLFHDALIPSSESVEGERRRASSGEDIYRTTAVPLVNRFRPHDGGRSTSSRSTRAVSWSWVSRRAATPRSIRAAWATSRSRVRGTTATYASAGPRARVAGR